MLRLISLLSGMLFGAGLAVSGMVNPHKVRGFLDVTGDWDPSLVLVMAGAVVVATLAFRMFLRRDRPLLDEKFFLPDKSDLDARLIGGAAVFGVGWGMAGYCPGPAVAALSALGWQPVVVFASMIAGSFLARLHEPGHGPQVRTTDG